MPSQHKAAVRRRIRSEKKFEQERGWLFLFTCFIQCLKLLPGKINSTVARGGKTTRQTWNWHVETKTKALKSVSALLWQSLAETFCQVFHLGTLGIALGWQSCGQLHEVDFWVWERRVITCFMQPFSSRTAEILAEGINSTVTRGGKDRSDLILTREDEKPKVLKAWFLFLWCHISLPWKLSRRVN